MDTGRLSYNGGYHVLLVPFRLCARATRRRRVFFFVRWLRGWLARVAPLPVSFVVSLLCGRLGASSAAFIVPILCGRLGASSFAFIVPILCRRLGASSCCVLPAADLSSYATVVNALPTPCCSVSVAPRSGCDVPCRPAPRGPGPVSSVFGPLFLHSGATVATRRAHHSCDPDCPAAPCVEPCDLSSPCRCGAALGSTAVPPSQTASAASGDCARRRANRRSTLRASTVRIC